MNINKFFSNICVDPGKGILYYNNKIYNMEMDCEIPECF